MIIIIVIHIIIITIIIRPPADISLWFYYVYTTAVCISRMRLTRIGPVLLASTRADCRSEHLAQGPRPNPSRGSRKAASFGCKFSFVWIWKRVTFLQVSDYLNKGAPHGQQKWSSCNFQAAALLGMAFFGNIDRGWGAGEWTTRRPGDHQQNRALA